MSASCPDRRAGLAGRARRPAAASRAAPSRPPSGLHRAHPRRRAALAQPRRSDLRQRLRSLRRPPRRAAGRGQPRHVGILSRPCGDHAAPDRDGTASASWRSRPIGPTPLTIDRYVRHLPARPGAAPGVPSLPDLDVAQHRRRSLRRMAARPQRSGSRPSAVPASSASTSTAWRIRSPPCSPISTRSIPAAAEVARERYGCLDAVAARSRGLRPCRAERALSRLRGRHGGDPARSSGQAAGRMPPMTASSSSMPRRMRGWLPPPSATTAPCTTAAPRAGTCATATCSTPCSTCSTPSRRGAKAVVWAHNSAHRRRPLHRHGPREGRAQSRRAVPRAGSARRPP